MEADEARGCTSTAIAQGITLFPDKPAVIDSTGVVTYRDLVSRIGSAQRRLVEVGLSLGDRVIVRSTGGADFVVVVVAMFFSGVVPILANPKISDRDLGEIARDSGATAIVHARSENVESEEKLPGEVGSIFEIAELIGVECVGDEPIAVLQEDPDRILLALLSGGTTSVSKVIPRSEAKFRRQIAAMSARTGWSSSDVFVCACPAAHLISLGSPGIIGSLIDGSTILFVDGWPADASLEAMSRWGGTFVALVPTLASHWAATARRRKDLDLSRLRVVLVGGAAITGALVNLVSDALGGHFMSAYGISEGFICTTLLGWEAEDVATNVGFPVDEQDSVRIVDGEIQVAGPYLTDGYWTREPSRNASFGPDGYFRTGDEGSVDDEGRLLPIGRRANTVMRDGVKHNVEDLEREYSRVGWVKEVIVSPLGRDTGDQAIVAVLRGSPPDGGRSAARQFRGALRLNGTPMQKFPDHVIVVESIPVTAVGKVDRKATAAIVSDVIP